jgi:hypothetical protein
LHYFSYFYITTFLAVAVLVVVVVVVFVVVVVVVADGLDENSEQNKFQCASKSFIENFSQAPRLTQERIYIVHGMSQPFLCTRWPYFFTSGPYSLASTSTNLIPFRDSKPICNSGFGRHKKVYYHYHHHHHNRNDDWGIIQKIGVLNNPAGISL